ncbi:MAG: hypothetical protein J6A46_02725, partial [Clostridia bacterium]|nr:hypothetical protein [Clostridia bacterium]
GLTGTDEEQAAARYEEYIRSFVDSTGADYVQYDDYPMQAGKISSTYLRCMQIVAEICKEKDIEFRFVAQTFGMYNNGNLTFRAINEEEARWLNNTMLGFGVKQISYFTYWTKQGNSTTGETFIDGASFITRAGHKTDLYYFMQEIMAENQKFAPTLLNFDYQGSRVYEKLPCNFDNRQTQMLKNDYTFKKIENVSVNKECALITELFDKENSRYMYMVMNTVSPENKGSKAFQSTEITFSEEYTHVVVYKDGVGTPKKLDGNKATVKLAAGEAVYLLPY